MSVSERTITPLQVQSSIESETTAMQAGKTGQKGVGNEGGSVLPTTERTLWHRETGIAFESELWHVAGAHEEDWERFTKYVEEELRDELRLLQLDALWPRVSHDVPIAREDPNSPEWAFIANLVSEAQQTSKINRTPLHRYILAQWTQLSSRTLSNPPGVCGTGQSIAADAHIYAIHHFVTAKLESQLGLRTSNSSDDDSSKLTPIHDTSPASPAYSQLTPHHHPSTSPYRPLNSHHLSFFSHQLPYTLRCPSTSPDHYQYTRLPPLSRRSHTGYEKGPDRRSHSYGRGVWSRSQFGSCGRGRWSTLRSESSDHHHRSRSRSESCRQRRWSRSRSESRRRRRWSRSRSESRRRRCWSRSRSESRRRRRWSRSRSESRGCRRWSRSRSESRGRRHWSRLRSDSRRRHHQSKPRSESHGRHHWSRSRSRSDRQRVVYFGRRRPSDERSVSPVTSRPIVIPQSSYDSVLSTTTQQPQGSLEEGSPVSRVALGTTCALHDDIPAALGPIVDNVISTLEPVINGNISGALEPVADNNISDAVEPVADDLDPIVPVGTWYRMEIIGVPQQLDLYGVFSALAPDRLIGLRHSKIGKRKKWRLRLSFKSKARRDHVLQCYTDLISTVPYDAVQAVEATESHGAYDYVLDPEYVEQCYAHGRTASDLDTLLDQGPAYRSILPQLRPLHSFPPPPDDKLHKEIKMRLLDFYRYPPLVASSQEAMHFPSSRARRMDRVEFTSSWLFETFAGSSLQNIIELRRLEMLLRVHVDRPANAHSTPFWVPLLATEGPYENLIRQIAGLAKLACGTVNNDAVVCHFRTERRRNESFGFHTKGIWYIEWESDLPSPRYQLLPGENLFEAVR